MKHFERITTEYVDAEDRICMAGTLSDGEVVQAWFTQRLLQRLVPALVQWLQAQDAGPTGPDALRAEVMHGFAQQAARAQLSPQHPVLPVPGDAVWLVYAVDVARHPRAVRLTFKGTRSGEADVAALGALTLAPQPLRQWLNILYDNYRKAAWPLQAWPDWVSDSAPAAISVPTHVH